MKGGIGVMHGDISQVTRERTINEFKMNRLRVLVATDVASRGLDIPNVDLIVQYHPPKNTETYIHRSGRTARAGASGTCVTFYDQRQYHLIRQIQDEAGIKLQKVSDLSKLDIKIAPATIEMNKNEMGERQRPRDGGPRGGEPYARMEPRQAAAPREAAAPQGAQQPLERQADPVVRKYAHQARRFITSHGSDASKAICHLMA